MERAVTDTCSVDLRIPRYISVGWQGGGGCGCTLTTLSYLLGKRLPMGHEDMFHHKFRLPLATMLAYRGT